MAQTRNTQTTQLTSRRLSPPDYKKRLSAYSPNNILSDRLHDIPHILIRYINNVFEEGECDKESNVHFC